MRNSTLLKYAVLRQTELAAYVFHAEGTSRLNFAVTSAGRMLLPKAFLTALLFVAWASLGAALELSWPTGEARPVKCIGRGNRVAALPILRSSRMPAACSDLLTAPAGERGSDCRGGHGALLSAYLHAS